MDKIACLISDSIKKTKNDYTDNSEKEVRPSNMVDWKKVTSGIRVFNKNYKDKQIDKWTNKDFYHYINDLYRERHKKDWELLPLGNMNLLNTVKDKVISITGFCNNHLMKKYIDFFWKNYEKRYYIKYKDFSFKQLYYLESIRNFKNRTNIDCYRSENLENLSESETILDSIEAEEDFESERNLPFQEKMENSFNKNLDIFVSSFGYYLTALYLLKIKNISKDKVIKIIEKEKENLSKNNSRLHQEAINMTIYYSGKYKELSNAICVQNISLLEEEMKETNYVVCKKKLDLEFLM